MAKFVEMDERVKFKEQIEEKGIDGQVILINKFNVDPDKTEQFVKDWGEDAINFKKQPGFILHNCIKGLGKAVYSLIMQFGSHLSIIKKQLINYYLVLKHILHR